MNVICSAMNCPHRKSDSLVLLPSLSLLLSTVIILSVTSVQASRLCWTKDCSGGQDWCMQTCDLANNEFSCLAQGYMNADEEYVATFFGCHHAQCDPDCDYNIGTALDFVCCCSGDLCNSIVGLTPEGDILTPSPNPMPTPPTNPLDNTTVCETYDCSADPDNCVYGYQMCPSDKPYCLAEYEYSDSEMQYYLSKKECTNDLSGVCNRLVCHVYTDGDHTRESCCCKRDLCNQNIVFSDEGNVDMMIVDPCEDMGCDHSCIVHNGTSQCFCDSGHILSDDKMTCVDVNECAINNGGCVDYCINEIGSYHCGCRSDQKLSADGVSCEETGLICYNHQCNGTGCDVDPIIEYCDEETNVRSRQHCQATYYLRQDGTFEPRLLGCFQGSFDCTDDKRCILETTAQESIYFCCCIENYCNADETLLFPNVTSVTLTPPPVPHTTDNPTTPTETSTGTPKTKDGGLSRSKLTFIIVVVVCILLLVPVFVAAVGCLCYVHYGRKMKESAVIDLQNLVRDSDSPDMMFRNLSFIDKIGQGRFAAVWRAKNIDAEVAVKVFPNSQLSQDSWMRECEIYRTPELEHKNVLSFRGSIQKETEFWIVTDYYSKGSLHDLLKMHTLSLKQFCELAESAAVGLAHLHDQRIVDGVTKKPSIAHRDLKSKNILIRNNYTCVISDFGLAIKFLNEETSSDAHGQVGTSRYMAPEVLEGAISFQREAYLRIDVYAFALILWELASRTNLSNGPMKQYRPPFEEYVSSNPSIEEMRDVVVTQFKRPTIAKGFTTNSEYDCLQDTIEESWDQEPEARLSAQCIAERIRTFKLPKFGSKDSGLVTHTNSPAEVTYNSDSIDSQLPPTTPSLSSSGCTMSPQTSKTFMLDSGTESLGLCPSRGLSSETMRLGGMSSNSSFLPYRNRNSTNFDSSRNFGGSTARCNYRSNRDVYSLHSTETTV